MDNNCKIKYYYFIAFFSLFFHRYLSLHRLYLISSLSITLYLFPLLLAQESCSRSLSIPRRNLAPSFSTTHRRSRRLMLQPSSPTSTALTTDLQISLNRVVGVRFGMGFDVGFGSAFWIGVVWVVGRGFGLVGLGF